VNILTSRQKCLVGDLFQLRRYLAVAGERALVSLYSGSKKGDRLDELRLQKFCQKVDSSTSYVQPQTLPLTSAACTMIL